MSQDMTFICPKRFYCARNQRGQNHCVFRVRPKCVPASTKNATEDFIKEYGKSIEKEEKMKERIGIRRLTTGL